ASCGRAAGTIGFLTFTLMGGLTGRRRLRQTRQRSPAHGGSGRKRRLKDFLLRRVSTSSLFGIGEKLLLCGRGRPGGRDGGKFALRWERPLLAPRRRCPGYTGTCE